MENFTPLLSSLGGIVIGAAAALLLWSHGRICGISGIAGGLFTSGARERPWRLAFLAGLMGIGIVGALVWPAAFAVDIDRSSLALVSAGLLVGVGTRLGNGCTSGHGVCGLSRLSSRSLVATLTFIAAGAATVWLFTQSAADAL